MNLDQDLRRALKRVDPPEGFDDRILSRIAAGETVPSPRANRRWTRVTLPLAASIMLAFGAAYYLQHEQQQQAVETQAHAEAAAREVVLALQIASEKISAAQTKVEEITRYDPTNNH